MAARAWGEPHSMTMRSRFNNRQPHRGRCAPVPSEKTGVINTRAETAHVERTGAVLRRPWNRSRSRR